MDKLYHYKAKLVRVYDGDTVHVDVDLGFGITAKNINCRVARIDTPEIRGASDEEEARGIEAREYLRKLLQTASDSDSLMICTTERGKYGRWIAEIYVTRLMVDIADLVDGEPYVNVSDLLVRKKMAILREEWGN